MSTGTGVNVSKFLGYAVVIDTSPRQAEPNKADVNEIPQEAGSNTAEKSREVSSD